jgi:methylated-DNA-[protein]-cysteine S-methyltransferase
MKLRTAAHLSPIGSVRVVAGDDGICGLTFDDHWDWLEARIARRFPEGDWVEDGDPCGAVSALVAYFDGDVGALDRVPVDVTGTAFQVRVWQALRTVKPGQPVSYGMLARQIGHPKAVRAVGTANGSNLVPLILPCHRVVAARGALGGYGLGLDRKRWLLDHEAMAAGL